jgi:hypothetical protein
MLCKKEGKKTGLLQTEATYKSEIINIAEYLATKYKETYLKKNI